MNYMKKLKMRLWFGISYVILGLALIVAFNLNQNSNDFFSYWGLALVVVGLARIRNYLRITKNAETIRKCAIQETDERNVSIVGKARGIAFYVYILAVAVAVIVLQLIGKTELAATLSWTICFLLVVYWIAYFILRKIH